MYNHGDISPFSVYNISMKIYLLSIFVMFHVFIVYEISLHDKTLEITEKYILILEHLIFLSGILAEVCLFQILIPYFGGFLSSIWILYLLKIGWYWDKPFFDFSMFKNHLKSTNNTKEGREEVV